MTKEVTVFKCDLCKDNTRQVDTAHGGTLHHLLGNGHLKKVVASWWPELGAVDVDKAAAELAVRLPVSGVVPAKGICMTPGTY